MCRDASRQTDLDALSSSSSIDIKDMCTENGEELVFRELDQRFPDKVAPYGRSHGGSFEAENHDRRDDGGFHWTVKTCIYPSSVGRCELAVGSQERHCLSWMSTREPRSKNDHVCNTEKLGV